MYSRLEDLFRFLAILILGFLIVWLVTTILEYVLKGLALYRMAQNAGLPSPGLAWVPVANSYLLGCLCERSAYFCHGKPWKFSILLPAADLLGVFGANIFLGTYSFFAETQLFGSSYSAPDLYSLDLKSLIENLLALACLVVLIMGLHSLYKDYAPGREVLYTVLAVIFGGIGRAILLMTIRNRVPLSAANQGWNGWGPPGGYPPPGPPDQPPPPGYGWEQPVYRNGPPGAGWDQPPCQSGPNAPGWGQPPYPYGPDTTGWHQPPDHSGPGEAR